MQKEHESKLNQLIKEHKEDVESLQVKSHLEMNQLKELHEQDKEKYESLNCSINNEMIILQGKLEQLESQLLSERER